MTEQQIQNAIIREFGVLPWLRIWRNNTGAAMQGNRMVRYGIEGQADISGIIQTGIRLEIEVKAEHGRQSDSQRRFGEMITRFGGLYILARSVADVWKGCHGRFETMGVLEEYHP